MENEKKNLDIVNVRFEDKEGNFHYFMFFPSSGELKTFLRKLFEARTTQEQFELIHSNGFSFGRFTGAKKGCFFDPNTGKGGTCDLQYEKETGLFIMTNFGKKARFDVSDVTG